MKNRNIQELPGMALQMPAQSKGTHYKCAPGGDGFIIQRSNTGTSGWAAIDTVGANAVSYTDTGLAETTKYYYRVLAYNGAGVSDPSNTADGTTLSSIRPENDIELSFYPNPVSNSLFFTASISGNAVFEAYDMSGRRVVSENITLTANQQNQINLPALPGGIYLAKVTCAEGAFITRQFLVKGN